MLLLVGVVSCTYLRSHETVLDLVCVLPLEKNIVLVSVCLLVVLLLVLCFVIHVLFFNGVALDGAV